MSDVQTSGHEDEIERMVKELMAGVERFGNFNGATGIGAVLTFTNRFLQTMITLSPDQESKENNTRKMAMALRHLASSIEFEYGEQITGTIH
jgi:hypothetical protein